MIRRFVCAVVMFFAAATAASAQSWELSALGGYTPPAELENRAKDVDSVTVGGGFTFAFQATRFLTPHWGAEVSWSQQPSSLELTAGGNTGELLSMMVSQLHANAVYRFGAPDARTQPFVFAGLGSTFFRAQDVPSETKLAVNAGAGVRTFPWPSVGFIGQLRYKPTWLDDESQSDFCDPFGFCQAYLRQFEFAAGMVLRF